MINSLSPEYTFSNFVRGKNNSSAFQACFEFIKSPDMLYNPLFIWGVKGTGKTHLINAAALEATALYPDFKIIFVTAEMFINEWIEAIKDRMADEFRSSYITADILFMDGVDFLNGKRGTQEELLHIINHLYNGGNKIIITSRCRPEELKFNEPFISRLISGLVVNIKPPDFNTRMDIIRKKIADEKVHMPEDVIEYIAKIESKNVRELEGLIARMIAYSSLKREEIHIAWAKEIF